MNIPPPPPPLYVPPPPPIVAPIHEVINTPISNGSPLLNGKGYYQRPDTSDYYIKSLLLLLNASFPELHVSNLFTQFKSHIDYFTTYIDFTIQQQFIYYPFKLPIFNIYDDADILNKNLGSDRNLFYHAGYKLTEYINITGNIMPPLLYISEYNYVIDNLMYLLYFISPACDKDTFILNFGSLYHATCLLFKKLPNSDLIKVVHINTGFGIDVNKITGNGKTYHNLFEKNIYLTPEMIPPFIKFLKPFLFFRIGDLSDINLPINYTMIVLSDYIDRVLNYQIDFDRNLMNLFYDRPYNNIYEFYVNMYNTIKNDNGVVYTYLNNLFNLQIFQTKMQNIGVTYNQAQFDSIIADINIFNANSFIFYNYFVANKESAIAARITNLSLYNYIRKALDNFDIHFNQTIYFTSQSAGTCMFKSLLLSMFYCLIYENNAQRDNLIMNIYLEFSENCHVFLMDAFGTPDSKNVEYSYISQTSNFSKIINQLVKDDIISDEYKLGNIIMKKTEKYLPLDFIINNTPSINIEDINISVIPLTELNQILDNIRNNINRTQNLRRINDIILQFIKKSDFNDIHRSFSEIVLLSMVWELYYHKDKWEDRINQFDFTYTNIIFLDLLAHCKFRLDFNYIEVEWISKFYVFLTFHHKLIDECELLKNVIIQPETPKGQFYILLPMNIINYKKNPIYKTKIDVDNLDQVYIDKLSLPPEPSKPIVIPLPPPPPLFNPSASSISPPPPRPTPINVPLPPLPLHLLLPSQIQPPEPGTNKTSEPPLRSIIKLPDINPMEQIPFSVLDRMYETSTLSRIYKYFNHAYFKTNSSNENYSFINYMFDNDIFNFNRFMINHFKHNNNFHIELRSSFENIKSNETYKNIFIRSNIINTQQGEEINNIYIMQSFIDAFSIYSVYLTEVEKYKIIKQMFISCKPIIDNNVDIIISRLIIQVVELINVLLPDVYICIESSINFMNFKLDKYFNQYFSYLYDNNSANTKAKYDLSNPNLAYNLFKGLLELFENDRQINRTSIDTIILRYANTINSPYFYVNKTSPMLRNLVIGEITISDEFNKIHSLTRNTYVGGNIYPRHFLLGELLNNGNMFSYYINERRTHLVYVLEEHKYNNQYYTPAYMPENVIIVFEIKPGPAPNQIILKDNAYINSNPIIFSYDGIINDYPFMAFSSDDTINFIEKRQNDYILHCIINNRNIKEHPLHRLIRETYDNYYINFHIKPNFLTPIIDYYKQKYMNIFYTIFSPIKSYVRYIHNNIKNYNTKLHNLLGLDVLSDFKVSGQLENIFGEVRTNINKLINDILSTQNVPYIDLVEWINNNTKNSLTPYDDKLKCDLDCRRISGSHLKTKIKNVKYVLLKIRKYLTNKLTHEHTFYIDFLHKNHFACSLIMQANIYINSLNRLLNAIYSCEPILCHELIEMNNIFNKKPTYYIPVICTIVELIFGNIVKNEQWNKINSIYNNYINRRNTPWEVHQFMMGKGKSSIITPMLLSMLYYNNERNINLVVPEHLKKQTENTLIEYKIFLGINISVYSDTDIKLKFLDKSFNIYTSILVIDEFDFMYNPLQSNFNKIKMEDNINDDKIERVFNLVNDMLIKRIKYKSTQFKVVSEIKNILSDVNNIKNVSYGMSVEKDYRYCIPYMRKDSPNEGSKFSSILLTIVLTILYFYNPTSNKYILEEKDLKFLYINKNKKLLKKLLKLYNINQIHLDDILYDFRRIDINDMPVIPENIMREYLLSVFRELKKALIIQNCSFIDIINMNSKWQVGYSGTVNINMNFPSIQHEIKYNKNIIADTDENKNVKNALKNYSTIHTLLKYEIANVFDIVVENNYSVLIDGCAALKDYDNKEVAEILYNKSLDKGKKKTIIYLLKDDTKMIYNGKHILYQEKMYKTDEIIYYYSQRHIVGIDFKQPNILNGLILINNTNIYTDISQAIYRMRKLNKGHTVKICYIAENYSSLLNSSEEVYNLIVSNEERMTRQNHPMLLYQYLKFYFRKTYTTHYFEVDLDIFTNVPTIDDVINKIYHNILGLRYTSNNPEVNKKLLELEQAGELIVKDEREQSSILSEMLQQLNTYGLDTLLKLVFNINSVQKEVSSETQTQKQTQTETESSRVLTTTANDKFNEFYRRISFKLNPFKDLGIFVRNFTYLRFNLGNNMLIFSYNLVKNIPGNNDAIIIKLEDDIYMLDHISVFSHYVYMKPIYSLNGQLINNFVFNNLPNLIDFSTIFNYKLVTAINGTVIDTEINIGYIIFGITEDLAPTITHNCNQFEMFDLKVLMALSKIDIFNTKDPELINVISQIDLNNEYKIRHHRIFEIPSTFVRMYTEYLLEFYQNIQNYKTTDNTVYDPNHSPHSTNRTSIMHDLGFTLNKDINLHDLEYFQVLNN